MVVSKIKKGEIMSGCAHCSSMKGYDRTYRRCANCGKPYNAGDAGGHWRTGQQPPPATRDEVMEAKRWLRSRLNRAGFDYALGVGWLPAHGYVVLIDVPRTLHPEAKAQLPLVVGRVHTVVRDLVIGIRPL